MQVGFFKAKKAHSLFTRRNCSWMCVFVLRSLHTDQYDKTMFTYYISNGEKLKAAVTELPRV